MIRLFLSLLCAFCLLGCTLTPLGEQLQDDNLAELKARLPAYPAGTQLALAIVEPDGVRHWGLRRETQGWQSTDLSSALFQVGSLSKALTAYIALKMVQDEDVQLDLDTPIATYLDGDMTRLEDITLRHLLTHTSGVPFLPSSMTDMPVSDSNPFAGYDQPRLRDYVQGTLSLQSRPGTEYLYSNLGYALVGWVLSSVSQRSYAQLVEAYVAMPLALSSLTTDPSDVSYVRIQGLDPNGDPTADWQFASFVASGGLWMHVQDLVTLTAHMMQDHGVLSAMREPQFQVTPRTYSAMPWHVSKSRAGTKLEQTGATGGFTSAWMLRPDRGQGVVILSNVSLAHADAAAIADLAEDILQTLK